jgi:hypothetical protein
MQNWPRGWARRRESALSFAALPSCSLSSARATFTGAPTSSPRPSPATRHTACPLPQQGWRRILHPPIKDSSIAGTGVADGGEERGAGGRLGPPGPLPEVEETSGCALIRWLLWSLRVQVSRTPRCRALRTRCRSASEKRQGTKSLRDSPPRRALAEMSVTS